MSRNAITAACLAGCIGWGLCTNASASGENRVTLGTFLRKLPPAETVRIDPQQALLLSAYPLSCIDHPQDAPQHSGEYLWQFNTKPHIPDGYAKTRAFYGCYDWHSSVNSLWTMLVLAKHFPASPVNQLFHEKLKDHLGPTNLAGELEFFKQAKDFEKPYGYSWLLKLRAELTRARDPEVRTLAPHLAPLAGYFSQKLVAYFNELPYATRVGVHPNTAFSMNLVLDATAIVPDAPLRASVLKAANRFFLHDTGCPTAYEPGGSDFLSPCLTEAKLMSRVLPRQQFGAWLNRFLPPLDSPQFHPLTTVVDVSGIHNPDLLAGKSHLIGLAWQRAEAMLAIANALPPGDARVPVLHRLAALQAEHGMQALSEAGYLGSHWLGTFVAMYMETVEARPR